MIRRTLAAAAALILLAGCGGTAGAPTDGTGPAKPAASAAPSSKAPAAKIGDAYAYSDGMKVEITKAKSGKASKTAAPKAGAAIVILTVRLTNGTKERFDAALMSVEVSSGADGDQAEAVFDSEQSIEGSMSGSVVVGKSKSAVFGFQVPKSDQDDLTVEVRPGLDYEPAIFTGKV